MTTWHVYPVDDMYEHAMENQFCWCQPLYDEENNIVVHNAFDERDAYEPVGKPIH